MLYTLLLSILLGPLTATTPLHANKIPKVYRNDSGQIIIKGKNCNELTPHVEAIRTWTVNQSEQNSYDQITSAPPAVSSLSCDPQANEIDITSIVPEYVAELQDVFPKYSGPNCWNSALTSSHLIDYLRYSTPEELTFWLSSPLCRNIGPGEPLRPGDLIAIRGGSKNEEEHGFIYISPSLAYSKNGYSNASEYSIQSLPGVYETYDVIEPETCTQLDPSRPVPEICWNHTHAFRCQSFRSYLQLSNHVLREMNEQLDNIECTVSEKTFRGLDITGRELDIASKKLSLEIDRLITNFKTTIKDPNQLSCDEINFFEEVMNAKLTDYEFFLKSIKVRLDATREQIEFF